MVTLCQNIKSGRILKMPKYFSHLEPLAKSDGRHFSGKSGEHAGRHHGGAPSPTRGQSSDYNHDQQWFRNIHWILFNDIIEMSNIEQQELQLVSSSVELQKTWCFLCFNKLGKKLWRNFFEFSPKENVCPGQVCERGLHATDTNNSMWVEPSFLKCSEIQ